MMSLSVATNATVSNLSRGVTYYFAVTAYDATTGLESPYSNEATYTPGAGAGGSNPTLQFSLTQGKAVLACTGLPGTNYNILASTNLAKWSVIGSAVAAANGTFQFTAAATNRFCLYKLQQH
jgi:hypothetical protein